MSKIDYQKLREIAEKTKIAGEAPVMPFDQRINALNDFMKHFSPDIALALLDERERNQQYIKSRDQENEEIALTVGKLRVELEAEKQRAKVLFMENARLKSGIAGLIHLGIRYADVEVMKIAGDAQLSKRIMFREYDRLIITKGYPKRDDSSRRIDVPYGGYEIKTITHPHFGDKPVKVYAIKVNIDG
ncbi:ead/Ea22-like family protein [Escherichia coli]|uniref:ead/Ea22-like family protein n=2 Tax=Escherichia coli TaxID=562 RepID=UPI003A7F9DD6